MKKILSFIMVICFIIPCIFMLSACSDDDGINLAGKRIVADVDNVHIHWEHFSYTNSYYDVENEKLYQIEMSLDGFIEEYIETDVFSRVLNKQNLDTIEKVKAALIEYALPEVLPQYPSYTFSADATTVTEYVATDTNFTTPLKTYSVQLEQQNTRRIYSFYDNNTKVGEVDCTNIIQYSTIGGFGLVELDLSEITDVMVTLTAEDGSTCEVPMCRYEEELNEFFGKSLQISISLLYKIA